MKKLKLAAFLAVIMTSCIKDDYNLESAKINYSPGLAAPLLTASIEASQILTVLDSTMFNDKNSEKLLEFTYSSEIYSFALSEFIDIKDLSFDFEFQLEPLRIEDIPTFQTAISLESVTDSDPALSLTVDGLILIDSCSNAFPPVGSIDIDPINFPLDGASFNSATFSEGELSIELKNGWPTPLNIDQLILKNLSDNSIIGTLNYNEILPGDSSTKVIDLAGKTVESNIVGEFVNVSSAGTGGQAVCVSLYDEIIVTVNGANFVVVSGAAEFPNQEVINETVDSPLNFSSGEELESLKLKSGELTINVNYGIEEAAKIYIELPYAKLGGDGDPFKDSIPIGPGPTSKNVSFDLSGYTFDLTKNGQSVNAIEASITGKIVSSGSVVNFDTSNSVSAEITMSNIKPESIYGYFGDTTLSLNQETFDVELGESEILQKITFADPTVKISFHNSFGIPMAISSLDLTMKRDNDSASLNASSVLPFDIDGYDINSLDSAVTSELVLGSSTNISELINLWPNKATTAFNGVINPDGKPADNFALDASKMDITLDLTIPIYGTITDFNITDTIEIDSSMSQIFKYVKNASLRTNIDNGLPLEGVVKFYITDENYIILDSLESSDGIDVLIDAATVNTTGNVITNGFRQADLVADEDDVSLLKTSGNKLILSAVLNTANSGDDVKICSDYSIEIKMGILAKVLIEEEIGLSNSSNNQ